MSKTNREPDVWAITCLFNPFRSKARYTNYILFQKQLRASGCKLLTIELSLPSQNHELYPSDSDYLIQIKQNQCLWQKEALLNIGLKKIPPDVEIVCWIDADIIFLDATWLQELKIKMKNYNAIHLFNDMFYLSKEFSFALLNDGLNYTLPLNDIKKKLYLKSKPIQGSVSIYQNTKKGKFINGKWGFGWAIKRDILERGGGFYPHCIVGGGDTIFFNAVFWNKLHEKFRDRYSEHQIEDIEDYIDHLHDQIHGDEENTRNRMDDRGNNKISYLNATMCHLWHGGFKQRQYFDRYQILKVGNFNPYIDIINDNTGCLTWNTDFFRIGLEQMEQQRKSEMIEEVQEYLSHRSTDPDLIEYDNRLTDIYQKCRHFSKKIYKKIKQKMENSSV